MKQREIILNKDQLWSNPDFGSSKQEFKSGNYNNPQWNKAKYAYNGWKYGKCHHKK